MGSEAAVDKNPVHKDKQGTAARSLWSTIYRGSMGSSAPVCLLPSLEGSMAIRTAFNIPSPGIDGCSPVLQCRTTGFCG